MDKKTVSTSSLWTRLLKTDSAERFLRDYDTQEELPPFSEYIQTVCREKGLVAEHIIKNSGIDRTYGHQLFSGLRKPSRDKVLMLAFGIGLTPDETQDLLRVAGRSLLYPKIKRDAVIAFCLNKKNSLMETQEILDEMGLTLLGGIEGNG